jgi:hypothetical protein
MKSDQIICTGCHIHFQCGDLPPHSPCWCNAYPLRIKPGSDTACLCPSCLRKESLERINQLIKDFKLSGKAIDIAKYQTDKNVEGIDYYVENGLIVFSQWFLLKRGYCCDNACRHCPY